MFKLLLSTLFNLSGWRVVGDIPTDVHKAIIAVCPHSSWKDFLIGIGARAVISKKIGYLGKEELFKPPFGFIFYALGGKPVVRTKNQNQVEAVANTFKKYDEIIIALAPEGTRKNVEKLRTGFYFMAFQGGAKIIRCGFDFAKKQVVITEPFTPSGDFQKDMQQYFVPFFKTIHGTENKNWLKNYEADIF